MILFEILKRNLKFCQRKRNEILIRCPYCGDSKDISHAHFYIRDEYPFFYYCQRCNNSGSFSSETMKDLNFFDVEFLSALAEEKRTHKTSQKKESSFFSEKNDIILPEIKINSISENKINYLNSRYSFKLGLDEIKFLKIILNFEEFFILNNLKEVTYDQKTLRKLEIYEKYYIGFLSYDKKFIIFRRISDRKELNRYEIFNIFNKEYNETKKFYTIPAKINILSNELNLVMTEGIFDIISVWVNGYNRKIENNLIFIANNGTGYKKPIINFSKMGFLNSNIKIFADSDYILNYKRNILEIKEIFPYKSFELYFNQKLDIREKTDFGGKIFEPKILNNL